MKHPEQGTLEANSGWVLLLAGWLFASSVVQELRTATVRPPSPGPTRVQLESACPRELRRLPGIGPSRATAIAQMRWELGGARFPLHAIQGIGEKTAARVQAWLAEQ